jgi:trehalose 6-phosphate phosphatase
MGGEGVDALLAPFRARPDASVLALDYDGTIAPIVDDPALALPHLGIVDILVRLDATFDRVLVVSGRPVAFLQSMLPEELSLVGLYGLEGVDRGERWEHPTGGVWREVIADVAMLASCTGPEHMRVEPKDLSLTLHYRGHPEIAEAVTDYAAVQAERAGLQVRAARMSVELHPPIATDKGTAVESRAKDASNVLFAGDDAGDLAAFAALDRLAGRGVHTVRIAMLSDEAPPELAAAADLAVNGPDELAELLGRLA